MIYIRTLTEAYERRDICDIGWIKPGYKIADALKELATARP